MIGLILIIASAFNESVKGDIFGFSHRGSSFIQLGVSKRRINTAFTPARRVKFRRIPCCVMYSAGAARHRKTLSCSLDGGVCSSKSEADSEATASSGH
jgi:hypothetical protein